MRDVKKNQVERYLQSIKAQALTFSEDHMIVNTMEEFSRAYESFVNQNQLSTEAIAGLRGKVVTYYNYNNDLNSSYREQNDGRTAETGSNLQMLDDPAIAFVVVDFKQYLPSHDAPAAFVTSPIFKVNKKIGILIFQFPLDSLNTIMKERAGMDKSGETYLVGSDLLMRSDSYCDPQNHTVIASFKHSEKGKVDTEVSRAAMQGGHRPEYYYRLQRQPGAVGVYPDPF